PVLVTWSETVPAVTTSTEPSVGSGGGGPMDVTPSFEDGQYQNQAMLLLSTIVAPHTPQAQMMVTMPWPAPPPGIQQGHFQQYAPQPTYYYPQYPYVPSILPPLLMPHQQQQQEQTQSTSTSTGKGKWKVMEQDLLQECFDEQHSQLATQLHKVGLSDHLINTIDPYNESTKAILEELLEIIHHSHLKLSPVVPDINMDKAMPSSSVDDAAPEPSGPGMTWTEAALLTSSESGEYGSDYEVISKKDKSGRKKKKGKQPAKQAAPMQPLPMGH
ncbi:hypothetical protein P691DRAFT_785512, partial [Macrolepiota fuliginosa MF-IS2]